MIQRNHEPFGNAESVASIVNLLELAKRSAGAPNIVWTRSERRPRACLHHGELHNHATVAAYIALTTGAWKKMRLLGPPNRSVFGKSRLPPAALPLRCPLLRA